MSSESEISRRALIVKTAGATGAIAGASAAPAFAQAVQTLPPGFADQEPLIENWTKQLNQVVQVDLRKDAPELADPSVCERHRVYCYLLMKLIHRFWNGNKRGPLGTYPLREQQQDAIKQGPQRYRGDMIADPGGVRVNWDRYLGHNIACIAVDGNGEIIDFEFNHNEFFRSSAEHAESRMVRRLFGLTDIFDNWKTALACRDLKQSFNPKARAASLNDVTLYTSLESCAQCSGVMSLAAIKQVIYIQNDFTAYKIGNIMYNLANRKADAQGKGSTPGAAIPIAASEIGLDEFARLNAANLAFAKDIVAAGNTNPPDVSRAFFVGQDGKADFDPAISSFLCTDKARAIFADGGSKLDTLKLEHGASKFPNAPDRPDVLSNDDCLNHAKDFYSYADIEGYRGSPHKL